MTPAPRTAARHALSARPPAVGLAILALFWLAASPPGRAYSVGDHVDDFTLLDADGKEVSLYDYEGWVILLAFWTSG